jgi:hypothetical protein
VSSRDRQVDYYSQEGLEQSAEAFHKLANPVWGWQFNVVEFVENWIQTHDFGSKGRLTLKVKSRLVGEQHPGYVQYVPFEMHVDSLIWQQARAGNAASKAIVAHEFAHAVLHDKSAKNFSNDPLLQLKFAAKEYSAEWQAITWSDHFLLPDYLLAIDSDLDAIIEWHGIDEYVARRRLSIYQNKKARKKQNQCTEFCKNCGQASVIYKGGGKLCLDCKHIGN